MYTITEDNLMTLTFGILMFCSGLMMIFMWLKQVIRYGIDDEDLIMLMIPVILLLLGIVIILNGLGILVVV